MKIIGGWGTTFGYFLFRRFQPIVEIDEQNLTIFVRMENGSPYGEKIRPEDFQDLILARESIGFDPIPWPGECQLWMVDPSLDFVKERLSNSNIVLSRFMYEMSHSPLDHRENSRSKVMYLVKKQAGNEFRSWIASRFEQWAGVEKEAGNLNRALDLAWEAVAAEVNPQQSKAGLKYYGLVIKLMRQLNRNVGADGILKSIGKNEEELA